MFRYALPALLATLTLTAIAAPSALALEGAYPDSHPDWKKVPAPTRPDAAERAKELDARKAAIQADIKRLNDRLRRAPSGALAEKIKAKLKEIHKNYGWVPETQMVYGRRAMEPMIHGQDALPPGLLEAFVQLDKDLKARGADLIIVPLVPNPFFDLHRVVPGADENTEVYPGWTKMMLQMLEADLEVIDTVDEFRAEADNPILVSWVNDFHTGSTGRKIAAQALAERLQRYDFARELKGNDKLWKETVKTKTGASFPQRITTVNRMLTEINKGKEKPGQRTWPRKHPGKWAVLRSDAPDIVDDLKNRQFKYIDLDLTMGGDEALKKLNRKDLVMIGDSQLHSAVYGAGFPEFIMKEVGGRFRWGSKSWRGFSPPEIYREVVPDSADQPRVVVLTFLPKYFWNHFRRGKMKPNTKYKPRPMPPFKGKDTAPVAKDAVTATVKITKVSKKPTDDPMTLDYDEALMHVAAVVQDGPMKGKEIGLRYWILHDGGWTKADKKVRPGQTMKITMLPWQATIEKDRKLAQHQIFDTTDQDLLVPVYWITSGDLAPKKLIGK